MGDGGIAVVDSSLLCSATSRWQQFFSGSRSRGENFNFEYLVVPQEPKSHDQTRLGQIFNHTVQHFTTILFAQFLLGYDSIAVLDSTPLCSAIRKREQFLWGPRERGGHLD